MFWSAQGLWGELGCAIEVSKAGGRARTAEQHGSFGSWRCRFRPMCSFVPPSAPARGPRRARVVKGGRAAPPCINEQAFRSCRRSFDLRLCRCSCDSPPPLSPFLLPPALHLTPVPLVCFDPCGPLNNLSPAVRARCRNFELGGGGCNLGNLHGCPPPFAPRPTFTHRCAACRVLALSPDRSTADPCNPRGQRGFHAGDERPGRMGGW